MTKLEKIDYVLKALYLQTKEDGVLSIRNACSGNGIQLSMEEAREIKNILEINGFALFQLESGEADYIGQLTPKGVEFVECNSLSRRGTSILAF